jgi:hypothetical protein
MRSSCCFCVFVRTRALNFFYVETVVFKTLVQTVHYHRRYIIAITDDIVKQLTERLSFRNCSVRNS